jgi:NAD-dependent SIR2 family protein deacetylase
VGETIEGVPSAAMRLAAFLAECGEDDALVLSGAGISTESGIPDYRGTSGAARRNHKPMTYQTFIGDAQARHRYWARSYLGWQHMRTARPNAGHRAVARLQQLGAVNAVITQNVDGLHQAAGARRVIELHGGLEWTVCLHCGDRADRVALDSQLRALNPDFNTRVTTINPDGDAGIVDADLQDFTMIDCTACGVGPLKPDVVFFGESVPRERVDACFALLESASALVVLGTSLTVMSGYRFLLKASKLGIPIAMVNQGETRGDEQAQIRIDAPLGAVLTRTVDEYERAVACNA